MSIITLLIIAMSLMAVTAKCNDDNKLSNFLLLNALILLTISAGI